MCRGHEQPDLKRPSEYDDADSFANPKASKNGAAARVIPCESIDDAASTLNDVDCVAAMMRRSLDNETEQAFIEYLDARPRWPRMDDLHPLEATLDRVAIIDFSRAPAGADGLCGAIGYGAGLPPRRSPDVASAEAALVEVASVLPEKLGKIIIEDASRLLSALRRSTRRRQYKLMLELVRGDTCQKWHCDQNISRSIVTYAGPGTLCAHDDAVTRSCGGCVDAVCEEVEAPLQACPGDFLLMKGGLWEGCNGHGVAHRAPPIGPVPSCTQHRLMLKIDISEDF